MSGSDSPTFFHGQPWSSWIEKIGRDKPLSDEEPDTEPASSVMRLSVDDIDLYGFCPERDTFYGVVCEICNAIVKPQALIQHMESRHPSGNPNAAGQTNNVTTATTSSTATAASKALMKTPYCKLSKLKKSQSSGQLSVSNSNGTSTNSAGGSGGGGGSNSKTSSNSNHTPVKQQSQQQQSQQQSTNSNSSPRSPLESCGPGLGGGSPVKSPNISSNSNNNSGSGNGSTAQQPKRKRLKTERSLLKDREYDPDRHCGVWNDETGKPCTRSLTCKAHTVSLRRTVAGRSKAFDKLLAEHRASKEPQNQARTAATTAKVAAAELAVAPTTPAAPPPPNNPELEAPSSPPVLSLPDTYPLPQAVDLLYRCLAPHGSNKPTKLEEDFANELESSRRVDASMVNNISNSSTTGTVNATNVSNSSNNSVIAPMSVVLPSLSPIQTDGLSPQAPLLQFSSRNVGNNANSPMSADQPASTPVVPSNQQQQPNEAKTAPPMDIDTGSSITMFTSPASKSQVTVQISRSSQRNHVVAGNYSSLYEPTDIHIMTNGKRAKTKHEEYSPNMQLVETVTPYTNFDDISWSNCHPEPLAVSRWLRINSSRKQYNFNIH